MIFFKDIIPYKEQYKSWSKPNKITFWSLIFGIVGLLFGVVTYFYSSYESSKSELKLFHLLDQQGIKFNSIDSFIKDYSYYKSKYGEYLHLSAKYNYIMNHNDQLSCSLKKYNDINSNVGGSVLKDFLLSKFDNCFNLQLSLSPSQHKEIKKYNIIDEHFFFPGYIDEATLTEELYYKIGGSREFTIYDKSLIKEFINSYDTNNDNIIEEEEERNIMLFDNAVTIIVSIVCYKDDLNEFYNDSTKTIFGRFFIDFSDVKQGARMFTIIPNKYVGEACSL
ncbi:MAG: hypothetical protein V9E90_02270 [Saprospiraceae bacterium]